MVSSDGARPQAMHDDLQSRYALTPAETEVAMALHGGAAAWVLGATDEEVAPTVVEPAELWRMSKAGQAELAGHLTEGQVLTRRIEDIAHRRAPVLAELAAALGLSTQAEALDAMARPETSPFRGRGPFGAHGTGGILTAEELAAAVPDAATQSLEGRAPWRDDGMPLPRDVRAEAEELGYR